MDGRNVNQEINLDQRLFAHFKNWSLALGICMIVLGIIILSLSVFTTLLTVITLGIILAFRGLFDSIHALMAFREKGFWWRLFCGILSLVTGILLVSEPIISATTITFLVAVFLLTSGIFRAIAAPIEHESQWGLITFGGIVSFIFGFFLLLNFPTISLWFIGTLVGIEILLQGITMISLPFAVRAVRKTGRPSGTAYAR